MLEPMWSEKKACTEKAAVAMEMGCVCWFRQINTLKTTEASFLSVRKRNYKTGKGRKLKPYSVELELEESL